MEVLFLCLFIFDLGTLFVLDVGMSFLEYANVSSTARIKSFPSTAKEHVAYCC